ncbi:MAG: hypothetical protein ACTXOO_00305 [Sodalis sp. (in: enterobacteria)]
MRLSHAVFIVVYQSCRQLDCADVWPQTATRSGAAFKTDAAKRLIYLS